MPTLTKKLGAAKDALKKKGIIIPIYTFGDFQSARGIPITCSCGREHHVNSKTSGLSIVTVAHYQVPTGRFSGDYKGKVLVKSFTCECGNRLKVAYT